MSYWKNIQPGGALQDFVTVWRDTSKPFRWRFALLALVATVSVFSVMMQEGAKGPPKPNKVTYITILDPRRTDAQIMAENIANQKVQERLAAEQAARDEHVREVYKSLGRASGMDVDAIEAKAKADDKASAAKQATVAPN